MHMEPYQQNGVYHGGGVWPISENNIALTLSAQTVYTALGSTPQSRQGAVPPELPTRPRNAPSQAPGQYEAGRAKGYRN